MAIRAHRRVIPDLAAGDAGVHRDRGACANSARPSRCGNAGAGKTLLGLHFLAAGAQQGEPGLYFGFDEPAAWLLPKADAVGLDLSRAVAAGQVELLWQAPLDQLLDALAQQLLDRVRTKQIRRVFIDGLSGLEHVQPARHLTADGPVPGPLAVKDAGQLLVDLPCPVLPDDPGPSVASGS